VFINQRITIMLMARKLSINQAGFIPMILTIIVIIVAVIIFAYLRVRSAHQ